MTIPILLAIVLLVGVGAWLLLDGDLVQIALGALLLGHGSLLVLVGTRPGGAAPLLGEGGAIPAGVADPLPQALGLTAIVISFGVTALLLGVASRTIDVDGDGRADPYGLPSQDDATAEHPRAEADHEADPPAGADVDVVAEHDSGAQDVEEVRA